jgi:hypothetical protein
MAKTKISEYSATPASNTDISNINIAEGCSPSNLNNAVRSLMAQIKDLQAGTSGDTIPLTAGGTGSTTATDARTALSAAKSGANSDITSITGLTTPLTTAQGGTGTTSTTFANLTTNVTGTLPIANGGTGSTTLTANSVVLGNGTSALSANLVAPSTSGNVLTSNGTTWTSVTPAGGIGIGQTWQNVTGSRAAGVTYTNTTGKPIYISVSGGGQPSNGTMSLTVDGVLLGLQGFQSIASGRSNATMTAIVPNNSTYRADNVVGWSLVSWAELR